MRVYRWSKKNELFLYSRKNCIGAGGGGMFAVRVGEDFMKGHCGISTTFDNELLSDEEFTVKSLELWSAS